MDWTMSPVFCLPCGATLSSDVPSRLATAAAMGPAAVKACAKALTVFTDASGQSALLKKAVQEHVPEEDARVWCDTLLRDNPFARPIAMAFGTDPWAMIAGFLLPTHDWRVILNDSASRHPIKVEGRTLQKREREEVMNDVAREIAPLVTSNIFSSMCASCSAVSLSVPAADLMGRAGKQMEKNRTATNRMNAEQKEARAQTAPARLQVAEKRQKAADTHQKRKDNAAKARKGKSEKNKEEE